MVAQSNFKQLVSNEWANRRSLLANKRVVVWDLETTSLDYASGKIIEFGAVKFTLNDQLDVDHITVEEFDVLIDIGEPLSTFTTELTGITDSMLKEYGYDPQTAFKLIYDFMNDADVSVTQNGHRFDLPYLTYHMVQLLGTSFDIPSSIDTREVSHNQYPWITGKGAHSLNTLCKRYNVEYDSEAHHRAVYDARITAGVFLQQLSHPSFHVDSTLCSESRMSFLSDLIEQEPNKSLWTNVHESTVSAIVASLANKKD